MFLISIKKLLEIYKMLYKHWWIKMLLLIQKELDLLVKIFS
jgi:hypothetical protein